MSKSLCDRHNLPPSLIEIGSTNLLVGTNLCDGHNLPPPLIRIGLTNRQKKLWGPAPHVPLRSGGPAVIGVPWRSGTLHIKRCNFSKTADKGIYIVQSHVISD